MNTRPVEQIGSVYETIMGFNLEVAEGRSIAIRPVKSHGAPATINLEALLAVKSSDRAKWLKEQSDQKITGLALEPHLPKSLYMLSTGTKRKVFLAGAFASGAAVTLLDEPFAALDRASIGLVLELLQEAATHPRRAWVVADYVAPAGVSLAATVRYSDPCG